MQPFRSQNKPARKENDGKKFRAMSGMHSFHCTLSPWGILVAHFYSALIVRRGARTRKSRKRDYPNVLMITKAHLRSTKHARRSKQSKRSSSFRSKSANKALMTLHSSHEIVEHLLPRHPCFQKSKRLRMPKITHIIGNKGCDWGISARTGFLLWIKKDRDWDWPQAPT